ncbi:MAG: hypothetical protein L0215_16500 [Gemmataceae bacterium]|nr:hypothetical protein [Gemmataceae bacterium]
MKNHAIRLHRSGPVTIAVILAFGGLIWLIGVYERAPAQEAAKHAAKWEYCTILGGENLLFFTSKQEIRSKSWKELAKALKAPLKEGWEDVDWVTRMAIFDFLGEQGWELAHFARMTPQSFEALFKRRR